MNPFIGYGTSGHLDHLSLYQYNQALLVAGFHSNPFLKFTQQQQQQMNGSGVGGVENSNQTNIDSIINSAFHKVK